MAAFSNCPVEKSLDSALKTVGRKLSAPVTVDSIPTEIRDIPHWVNWRIESRNGKSSKPPVNPRTGKNAKINDPSTWTDLKTALYSAADKRSARVGFVFTKEGGIIGIDLDHCRNVETGEFQLWAQIIIDSMQSYTEISPSGDGVHILIRGSMPPNSSNTKGMHNGGKIEIYDDKRYFTVTGNRLPGTPNTIEYRQTEFDALYRQLFPQKTTLEIAKRDHSNIDHQNSHSDSEIVDRAMAAANGAKFKALWGGDTTEYASDDSRADLALCCHLAFWTGSDRQRIERLFRKSGLFREKWDREDYRDRTIAASIAITKERYRIGHTGIQGSKDTQEGILSDEEADQEAIHEKGVGVGNKKQPGSHTEIPMWELHDMGDVEHWKTEPLIWKIEGLIPASSIGFLSGAPKDGKSLLTCDQIVHIAQGRPWLERFETKSSQILYVAREDPARRLKERIVEINDSYGYGPIPRGRIHFLIRERILLTEESHIAWIYEQTRRHEFDFVVLDVLNRMIPGLDEMSAKDMANMVSILEKLNRELNVVIECVDHTRKPQIGKGSGRAQQAPNPFDLKGSIAKYGCADFMLCVSRTRQPGRIQFYAENKDTDEHPHFLIDISPKGSDGPKFRYAGDVEQLVSDMKLKGDANREKIRKSLGSDFVTSGDIAKKVNLSDATVRRHLNSLFKSGEVTRMGEMNKTRWRIRLSEMSKLISGKEVP
jgi:hypothetical protein